MDEEVNGKQQGTSGAQSVMQQERQLRRIAQQVFDWAEGFFR
jgi:hypothetical protein